jgi:hypothetical protein
MRNSVGGIWLAAIVVGVVACGAFGSSEATNGAYRVAVEPGLSP